MKEKEYEGRVEAVLVMPPGEGAATESLAEVVVEWNGFVGDKHFGATKPAGKSQKLYPRGSEVRNTRQVSIVSLEELQEMADALDLPEIKADWVGANLLLSGIPKLSKLPPGSRLFFTDGVGLVVEGENMPCTTAGSTVQQHYPEKEKLVGRFPKYALGKRGIVAWVEKPGVISAGDDVTVKLVEKSIRSS